MHSFVLQDWINIRGPLNAKVTQEEVGWLDLSAFQDVVIYLDVRQSSASPTIAFETAPARDDLLFQPLTSPASPITMSSSTPQIVRAFMATAYTPLARYLRWKISGDPSSSWDATFRALVVANAPGL